LLLLDAGEIAGVGDDDAILFELGQEIVHGAGPIECSWEESKTHDFHISGNEINGECPDKPPDGFRQGRVPRRPRLAEGAQVTGTEEGFEQKGTKETKERGK
jgi:hypothetical protein